MRKNALLLLIVALCFAVGCSNTPAAPKVESIYIETLPIKTNYSIGDSLDLTGLQIIGKQSDGSEIVINDYTTQPENGSVLATAGTHDVTVNYNKLTASFPIYVSEVISISIKTPPIKTTYEVDDVVDTKGMVLSVSYYDGTIENITSGFTVSPQVLDKLGTQTITVSYKGKTTTYQVLVINERNYKIVPQNSWWDDQPEPAISKLAVKSISFQKDKPSGTPIKEWNVDFWDKGYVKCYVYGTEDSCDVYVVGELIIASDCAYMFGYSGAHILDDKLFKNVTSISLTNLDTSNVYTMPCMFFGCECLASLDLRALDTSEVRNTSYMFCGCSSLTSLKFNGFNLCDAMGMFCDCSSLVSIDLSDSTTTELIFTSGMFSGCHKLKTLNLTGFNTNKIESHGNMFSGCGETGSVVVVDPTNKEFFDTTELGSSDWTYSSGKYTHN